MKTNRCLFWAFTDHVQKVLPHPPVLRGVQLAVDALKSAGHEVHPWTPHKHDYAVDLINNIYVSDGCTVSASSNKRRDSAYQTPGCLQRHQCFRRASDSEYQESSES